jgi:hypothetical protein
MSKKTGKKLFFVCILKAPDENSRIQIRNPVYGSKDPNPSQNVTDPEHCMAFMSATGGGIRITSYSCDEAGAGWV